MPDAFAPDEIPIGTISEWSGTIANIPVYWHLCDGTFGTPDLHAKFLRGAPAGNEAGTTGGEDTHVLLTSEMPSHNHSFSNTGHTHNASSAKSSAGHGTNISGNDGSSTPSDTSTTSGITVNNSGSDTAHENRPAFFELAYIYKVQ